MRENKIEIRKIMKRVDFGDIIYYFYNFRLIPINNRKKYRIIKLFICFLLPNGIINSLYNPCKQQDTIGVIL